MTRNEARAVVDLTLTGSESLPALTQVQGNTDAGVEFVDAYLGPICEVVDVGLIHIPTEDIEGFERHAQATGLTFESESVA